MGDGKIDFPCLEDCGAFFQVETLKVILYNFNFDNLNLLSDSLE